jgi:hypothetical protein
LYLFTGFFIGFWNCFRQWYFLNLVKSNRINSSATASHLDFWIGIKIINSEEVKKRNILTKLVSIWTCSFKDRDFKKHLWWMQSNDNNPLWSFFWLGELDTTCNPPNRISGIIFSVLASSVVDCGFKPRSDQTKDHKIGICSFSAKHTALRKKSTDWLARNQDSVSEWSDMSIRKLLFQRTSTIKSNSTCCQLGLRTKRTSSSSHWKLTCSLHIIAEIIAELGLNNNYSFTH